MPLIYVSIAQSPYNENTILEEIELEKGIYDFDEIEQRVYEFLKQKGMTRITDHWKYFKMKITDNPSYHNLKYYASNDDDVFLLDLRYKDDSNSFNVRKILILYNGVIYNFKVPLSATQDQIKSFVCENLKLKSNMFVLISFEHQKDEYELAPKEYYEENNNLHSSVSSVIPITVTGERTENMDVPSSIDLKTLMNYLRVKKPPIIPTYLNKFHLTDSVGSDLSEDDKVEPNAHYYVDIY